MPLTINQWRGDAPEQAAEWLVTVTEAIPFALYELAILGSAGVSYRADADDSRADIAAALVELLEALTDVEIDVEHTSGESTFVITGPVGEPLEISIRTSPGSWVRRIQAGVLPTAKVLRITLPATTTGGTWAATFDFGAGDETASGLDDQISQAALKTAIEALTTPGAGDIDVALVATSPRTYDVTCGGSLAGIDVTATADGSGLTGNATIHIETVQTVSSNAKTIQAIYYNAGDGTLTVTGLGQEATCAIISGGSADATELQSSLEEIYGEGNVTVVEPQDDAATWNNTFYLIFGGSLAGTTVAQVTAAVTGNTLGNGFVTVETIADGTTTDEFQLIDLAAASASMTSHTLTFDGQVTGAINGALGEANIIAELEALSNIAPGEVDVFQPISHSGQHYVVRFQSGLGGANQPAMLIDGAATGVSTLQQGSAPTNEIQAVWHDGTGGTFTLTYDGQTTAATAYNASAATVDTNLEALSTIDAGEVTVTGAGTQASPWLVEGTGGFAQTDIELLSGSAASLTGGKAIVVATTIEADPGLNEQQEIRLDPNASGGTFHLGFLGPSTTEIDYDETAANVETAFELLGTVGSGNGTTSGTDGGPYLVEFTGTLAAAPQPLITIDDSNLTISASTRLQLNHLVGGSGPRVWNEPLNWRLGHVLHTDEQALIADGDAQIEFGLRQRSTFTVDGSTAILTLAGGDFVDGQKVRLRTSNTLPAAELDSSPITLDGVTDYYIVSIDRIAQTCTISTAADGNAIVFTGTGTGTHTIEVQAALDVWQSFRGRLGLADRDEDGRMEDRPRYLAIGLVDQAENIRIGDRQGAGAQVLRIDAGASKIRGRVFDSGAGLNAGVPAINLIGTHADNEVEIYAGEAGFAYGPTESGVLSVARAFGGVLYLGPNVTGLDTVEARGGTLVSAGAQAASGGVLVT